MTTLAAANATRHGTMHACWWRVLLCSLALLFSTGHVYAADVSTAPGTHTLTLALNGLERSYMLHVPARYNTQTPTPLVLMLHGGGGTAQGAMAETEWALKAEKEGFLVAFPNARARDPARTSSFAANPQLWNDGSERFYPGQTAPDDVAFIAALLDELGKRFALDPRRVYLTGFSNGASMSFRAGADLSDRIAAIAPVAGALWAQAPTLRHPVPMLYITGTADPLNLIDGGAPKLATGGSDSVRAKPKPPVQESMVKWAQALGCPTGLASSSYVNGVRTQTYAGCRGGAEVVYIAVDGLGHTWAGGKSLLPESWVGKTSNKINATDVIWTFFEKHARAGAPAGVQALVAFASDEGLARLSRSAVKVDFAALANQFEAQSNAAFCGPTTAAIVLNALMLQAGGGGSNASAAVPRDRSRLREQDTQYLPSGADLSVARFTQESVIAQGQKTRAQVLGEPLSLNGKPVRDFGYQTRQLDEMLRANGASTRLVIVDDHVPEADVRADLVANLQRRGDYVVVTYRREAVGQRGGGHISPVGAYDAASDSFLVMDVNPGAAGWVWMPTATLVKGMRTFDTVENRGYVLVQAR